MEQVDEIKNKVDIVELISEYVPLKKAGRNWKANCPFHGEKTPSFMVNPELQIFKCFGCGAGGDAYTFIQKIEGMEFGEALKTLAKRTGITLTSYKPSRVEEEKEKLIKINNLAREAYQFLLTKHASGKKALEYVLSRGVTRESIEKFGIGYAPEEWNFLNDFLVKKKKFSIFDLVKTGLVVEGKNYDRFRNRIMFPLNNARGEVVGFAGRVLPGADEKSGGKYVNTPETEIYHKSELLYGFDVTRSEIKTAGYAVVVEGELDAICTYQAGIKNTAAIKGSALTQKQVELLARVTDRVVLALDADMAGNMAARRGIEIAEKAGLYVETVDWSRAGAGIKDAADMAITEPELLKKLTGETISIYTFFIDTAIKKYGDSVEGKSRAVKDVLPLLSTIEDEVRKDEYIKELARKTKTDPEAVRKQLNRLQTTLPKAENTGTENAGSQNAPRREMLEEYIVGLALRNKRVELLMGTKEIIKSDFWKKVMTSFDKTGDFSSISSLINRLPDELKEKVQEQMLLEDNRDLDFEKEWNKAAAELEEYSIREKIPQAFGKELLDLTKRLSELTRGV